MAVNPDLYNKWVEAWKELHPTQIPPSRESWISLMDELCISPEDIGLEE